MAVKKKKTTQKKALTPEVLGPESTPVRVENESDVSLPALSPSDPLRQYMKEAQRFPLLTPEEEYELAIDLKDRGNLQAAKKLVSANLRLVVKIAYEYRSIYANLMDLIQEGNIGLMKAVSKFDPSKGARLSYYASWWIRSYILKYLLDNFRLVKIGTTQAQKKLFYQLMREKERLENQGLLPAPDVLAKALDVREKDVIEMQHRLSHQGAEVSLDAPVGNDSQSRATYVDLLPDEAQSPDAILAHEELLKLLEDKLPEFEKTLDKKEKKVFSERILSESPKTLQEIATEYKLTRERVRQIEAKILSKLKDFIKPTLE